MDLRSNYIVRIVIRVPEAVLSDNRRTNIINSRASEVAKSDVPVLIQEDILAADVNMSNVLVVNVLQHISQVSRPLDALLEGRSAALSVVLSDGAVFCSLEMYGIIVDPKAADDIRMGLQPAVNAFLDLDVVDRRLCAIREFGHFMWSAGIGKDRARRTHCQKLCLVRRHDAVRHSRRNTTRGSMMIHKKPLRPRAGVLWCCDSVGVRRFLIMESA